MKFFKDKGFTTLELMTVIVIVGILIVIASPNLFSMASRNAVVSTTNELVGLIQFTKNNAKIANKPIVLELCASTEKCDMAAFYAEDSGEEDKNLRVLNFPTQITFTAEDDQKSIAFYADGTRGIHATNTSVASFGKDGKLASADTSLSSHAAGDIVWKISSGQSGSTGYFCRSITITTVGNVAVKEGCE